MRHDAYEIAAGDMERQANVMRRMQGNVPVKGSLGNCPLGNFLAATFMSDHSVAACKVSVETEPYRKKRVSALGNADERMVEQVLMFDLAGFQVGKVA